MTPRTRPGGPGTRPPGAHRAARGNANAVKGGHAVRGANAASEAYGISEAKAANAASAAAPSLA